MAYSDWTFLSVGSNAQTAQPYGVGFTAPSVSSGSYARAIAIQEGLNSYYAGFVPSSAAFTGVPSTKAIRVQSFIRRSEANVWPSLAVKMTPGALGSNPSSYRITLEGYNLFFRAPNVYLPLTNSGVYGDSWYSFRITVYPIATNVDRVICEQESAPGSGVWSSSFPLASGDITINGNLNPNQLVPWGGSTRNGVFVGSGNSGTTAFFDMLQVSLATAPVPIP